MFGLDIGAIITALFPLFLKLMEMILDRTKMSEEQKKAFIEFVRASQENPQPSARLFQLVQDQEQRLKDKFSQPGELPKP